MPGDDEDNPDMEKELVGIIYRPSPCQCILGRQVFRAKQSTYLLKHGFSKQGIDIETRNQAL